MQMAAWTKYCGHVRVGRVEVLSDGNRTKGFKTAHPEVDGRSRDCMAEEMISVLPPKDIIHILVGGDDYGIPYGLDGVDYLIVVQPGIDKTATCGTYSGRVMERSPFPVDKVLIAGSLVDEKYVPLYVDGVP